MLHARLTPSELYTRVDLDARIEGSRGTELTRICFDALISALGRAAYSAARGDRRVVVDALARSIAILGGLQHSVDGEAAMGDVLIEFYSSISLRLCELIKQPSEDEIAKLRVDVADVAAALVPRSNASALAAAGINNAIAVGRS